MQRRGMNRTERTREPNEPNKPNGAEPNERNTNLRPRVVVVCKGHDTVASARLPLRLLRAAFVAKLFSVFCFFLYFVFWHPQSFAANTDFLRTSLSCMGNSVRAAGWFRLGGCEINTTCMRLLGNAASLCVCVCGACGWGLAKMT